MEEGLTKEKIFYIVASNLLLVPMRCRDTLEKPNR